MYTNYSSFIQNYLIFLLVIWTISQVYSSCEQSYRLTESGNINVPPDYTDKYCSGPCLTETNLVLDCIENIMLHFKFYNKATIQDIRDTIKAGCSHGPEKGSLLLAYDDNTFFWLLQIFYIHPKFFV